MLSGASNVKCNMNSVYFKIIILQFLCRIPQLNFIFFFDPCVLITLFLNLVNLNIYFAVPLTFHYFSCCLSPPTLITVTLEFVLLIK